MTPWQEYLLEVYDEIKALIVGSGFLICVICFLFGMEKMDKTYFIYGLICLAMGVAVAVFFPSKHILKRLLKWDKDKEKMSYDTMA